MTSIEWTDATWNPVTGCLKVSPGCAHCYAERLAPKVFAGQTTVDRVTLFERKRVFTDVRTHEDRLDAPLRWRKPRRVFVNSMSDLFHEDVPDAFIDRVFAVMALASQHTFQILTKRAERMRDYVLTLTGSVERMDDLEYAAVEIGDSSCAAGAFEDHGWPLPNVWLGVSVENQHFADERIPLLFETPAAVRFISAEPLLGPVNLRELKSRPDGGWCVRDALSGIRVSDVATATGMPRLNWVIVGGESGPGARPFDLAWGRSIVQQCQSAGVPVFVKQIGAKPYTDDDMRAFAQSDRKGGDPNQWPIDLRVREFPEVPA